MKTLLPRLYCPLMVLVVSGIAVSWCDSAAAVVYAPVVRALELPEGATTIDADDPLLDGILNGAISTGDGPVVHDQAGATLSLGKTWVTWTDLSTGEWAAAYIYLYPYGWQVLGISSSIRTFEHNGARHLLHDAAGRLHAVYTDGTYVWYRLGVPAGERVSWGEPVQINNDATRISWSSLGTRGETLTLWQDPAGDVVVHVVWSGEPNRRIYVRRAIVDADGNVSLGNIVPTNISGSFPAAVADSTGRLHVAGEAYQAIYYTTSADGQTWQMQGAWSRSQTGCYAYRFPCLAVDSQDRVHLLWQAQGYQGYSGSSTWWVPLYTIRDPATGQWSDLSNPLEAEPMWQAPQPGQQVLFAYPNLLIDDRDNVHLAWHGTARSYIFAWDDTYYIMRPYDPATGNWGDWTGHTVLHARDHFGTGDGEDDNFTWVPSLAYRPGSDELYALIMFGTEDDEVPDPSVNVTEGALKTFRDGQWQPEFQNVTQTLDLKSWYPNVAPEVWVDGAGRVWLDMIWVDGTLDDYNVLFRRIDVTGRLPGDCNGDGAVDIFDVIIIVNSFGSSPGDPAWDERGDLNGNGMVDVLDVIAVVTHFGSGA